MQFKKISIPSGLQDRLTDMVQRNRLSHALLFLGKEGSGALPLSIAFAQYILCEKVNPKIKKEKTASLFGEEVEEETPIHWDDSCGVCPSCVKVEKLIHPDLHFSYPAIKRNTNHDKVLSKDYLIEWREFIEKNPFSNVADWIDYLKENAKIDSPANKQGNISRAECDDILHQLSLKAFEGDYKILIMWMPEFLQNEGNRLLKLIEEPPPNTLMIFVGEEEEAILKTILSRTQLVKIPSYSDGEIAQTLIDKGVDEVKAKQIASLSEGNMRESLLMMENATEDWQEQIRDWLNVTLKNNINGQLKWIEDMSRQGREKQKQFLKYFNHLIQQAIRVRYVDEDKLNHVPEGEYDFAMRLNKMCSREALECIIEELDKAVYFIERNAHAKMLFHALTIRLYHIIKDKSLILVR